MVTTGQPPKLFLSIGAPEFWARAREDIAAARHRLFVQAMTFEGDRAGKAVAEAIAASPAVDRRVLVDGYTRVNINDTRLTRRALRAAGLAAEVAATRRPSTAGHGVSFVASRKPCLAQSISGLGSAACIVGGIAPCSPDTRILASPSAPLEARA